jgi:hypothetical protein
MGVLRFIEVRFGAIPEPIRRIAKKFAPAWFRRKLRPANPKRIKRKRRLVTPRRAQLLQRAMLAGFGRASSAELEESEVSRDPIFAAKTALALARWYHTINDFDRAVRHLTLRRLAQSEAASDP